MSQEPLPIKPLDPFKGDGTGRLYVRILGCNGSGKSTFGRYLYRNDPGAFTFTAEGSARRIGTVFPTLGWAAVGKYGEHGGGADCLKPVERVFEALYRLGGTPFHILIEGSVISNARERLWQADLGMVHNFRRKALLIHLDYPLQECLRRIYARNGGKQLKREDKVAGNLRGARKTVGLYESRIAAGAPVTLRQESTPGAEAMVESLIKTMREMYEEDVFAENGRLSLRG